MKRTFQIIWVIASVALIVQLAHSIYDLSKRGSVVDEARARLQKVKEENSRLKAEEIYVQSPEYVERQARDKLNLARKGEVVAIIQKATPTPSPSEELVKKENWELWAEKFRLKR